MASEPKHRAISRELMREIGQGRYAPSGRLPSETQLVKRFMVSRPTVARALRDLQESGMIERRAGAGTYVRSDVPPSAAGSRQLGLLIPGLGTTEIFEVICGELASLARVHDYNLLWGGGVHPRQNAAASVKDAQAVCNRFIQRKVAGVFFAPFEHIERKEQVNRQLAESLRQAGIAVLLLDRDLGNFPATSEFDVVGINNFAGGYLLAEHLLKLGAGRIAFVARPLSAPTVNARAAGAREAIVAHGLSVPEPFMRLGEPEDAAFVASLCAGVEVDSIICANDYTAALLMRTLEMMSIRVPQHVRLVGFDDVKYATLLSVTLTTIHQPCREIAVTALRAMIERISDPTLPPRNLVLAPRLVVRESCGAYLTRRAGSVP
jgi:DNA-binding LacI/PurR family transcriptional regulator